MTIEQLHRRLTVVADEAAAPPPRITAIDVYRAGLRRRRARRWFSFAVFTVAAAGAAGGAVTVVGQQAASPAGMPGAVPEARVPTRAAPPGTCRALAQRVAGSVSAALPAEIVWAEPRLPEGQEDADCGTGGLFWLSFTYRGQRHELGFEGGTGTTERACQPSRPVVRCEEFAGGEVGHLNGDGEYGVLLHRDRGRVFFFLGVMDAHAERPLSTYELSAAARRIAREVYR